MYDKNTIRKDTLAKRRSLTAEQIEEKSRIITQKLFNMDEYKQSKLLMCYMDIKNEVRTGQIISKSLEEGKKVALPVMVNIDGVKKIMPYLINNPEKDLVLGGFDILEPDISRLEVAPFNEIDLVIMPGVAFGLNKHRIGYGKGYYDKFLPHINKEVPKIALAFEVQLVDEIKPAGHDIVMDMIITESRVI
jgi:5-formyltetrahydrofolate cyclo-ligase